MVCVHARVLMFPSRSSNYLKQVPWNYPPHKRGTPFLSGSFWEMVLQLGMTASELSNRCHHQTCRRHQNTPITNHQTYIHLDFSVHVTTMSLAVLEGSNVTLECTVSGGTPQIYTLYGNYSCTADMCGLP